MRINYLENNSGQKLVGKPDILVIARCQVKLLLFTEDNGIFFSIFYIFSQKMWEIYTPF